MTEGARGSPQSERRRRLLGSIVGGAAVVGGAGCQSVVTGGQDQEGLRFAQAKAPIEFDPVVLDDVPSGEVAMLVFDALYEFDEEATDVVPKIAAETPEVSRDGRRWTIPLRRDARFQNGEPVTAADVRHTFRAPVTEDTDNAGEVNMIESVTVLDESTVRFDLQYQFAPFPQYLTRNVVPKSVRTEDREAFNTEAPVGAGPFEFDRWAQGEEVVLTRWEGYWDDPTPNLTAITFVPVEEPTTRVTTLKTGTNHVVKQVPPQSWRTVEEMDGARVESTPGVTYFYLAFNCNEGPTADPRVREAIDYAFSMDEAVSQFVEPAGVRQYSPLPGTVLEDWEFPVEDWMAVHHERDVDRAKSMLDDSDSVPDDWTARIIVPPDDMREQIAVSVANGIEAAGYDATVRRLDWAAFAETYTSGAASDYNMFAYGWAGSPDPDTFVYFLFAHEMAGVTNGSHYENEEMDRAIRDARRTTSRDERLRLYTDAVTAVLEDRAHIPAYNIENSFGVRETVRDFQAHPTDQFSIVSSFNNASFRQVPGGT